MGTRCRGLLHRLGLVGLAWLVRVRVRVRVIAVVMVSTVSQILLIGDDRQTDCYSRQFPARTHCDDVRRGKYDVNDAL